MLTVDQLSGRRGERTLWQDIQFTLPPGRLLQVTGANGCGKTSLLRVLAGLASPATGMIRWQEQPIDRRKTTYQQQLSYLGHQSAVKQELTVQENLRFNGGCTDNPAWEAALAKVGLAEYAHHWGYQLSQGQKQRVALARLLLKSAPLWILDEPLSGLDAEMTHALQRIFVDQLAKGGMIVLATHHPIALTTQITPLHLS
jgi:heme exporter protein A